MTVIDEFNAAADPAMPTIGLALDPEVVLKQFERGLPRLTGDHGVVDEVKSIRVIRYKPGRRCVIEYDLRILSHGARTKTSLIGKIRAKRFGAEGYRLLDALWKAGFSPSAPDGICVPKPVGIIPQFRMWLQRRISGEESTALFLQRSGAEPLARRIAEAAHKIHSAGIPTDRQHTSDDELRILHECLPTVAELRPELRPRIDSLLAGCDRLARQIPETKLCGIHRDFYPAQVIVHRKRLYLLDFDLFCLGDPALDIGNFVGHMTELAVRTFNDAEALRPLEQLLAERFLELSGEHRRFSVEAYTLLTLVRHVYLSTQFADRAQFTKALLDLCESRLRTFGCL
jgi:aminoglycoside phosphotransferase (APT) family kinase protein